MGGRLIVVVWQELGRVMWRWLAYEWLGRAVRGTDMLSTLCVKTMNERLSRLLLLLLLLRIGAMLSVI